MKSVVNLSVKIRENSKILPANSSYIQYVNIEYMNIEYEYDIHHIFTRTLNLFQNIEKRTLSKSFLQDWHNPDNKTR